MKATEFCYWLQGYIELAEAAHTAPMFNEHVVDCIRAHLALVAKVEPVHDNLFVAWLTMRLKSTKTLDASGSAEVKRLLAKCFKHDIDPTYGGDQQALQETHDAAWKPGHGGGGHGQLIRC